MRTSSLADPSTGQPAGRAPGMSPAQAASRLAAGGPNVLPAPPDPAVAPRRGPIPGPLVVVLSAAAVLTNATGDWTDATVIILVIVVNTTAPAGHRHNPPGRHRGVRATRLGGRRP